MGQKVNPIGLRLGINRTWDSRWFADKAVCRPAARGPGLRKYLEQRLAQAGVAAW